MSTLISTDTSTNNDGICHVTSDTKDSSSMKTQNILPNTLFNTSFKNLIKVNNIYTADLGSDSVFFKPNLLNGSFPKRFTRLNISVDPFIDGKTYLGIIYCESLDITIHNLFTSVLTHIEIGSGGSQDLVVSGRSIGLANFGTSSLLHIGFNTDTTYGNLLHQNRATCKVILYELDYNFSGASAVFDHSAVNVNDIEISRNSFSVNNTDLSSINFIMARYDPNFNEEINTGNTYVPKDRLDTVGTVSNNNVTGISTTSSGFAISSSVFPNTFSPSTSYELTIKRDSVFFKYPTLNKPNYLGNANTICSYKSHYKKFKILSAGDTFVTDDEDFHTILVTIWDSNNGRSLCTKILGGESSNASHLLFEIYATNPSANAIWTLDKNFDTYTFNKSTGAANNNKCLIFEY